MLLLSTLVMNTGWMDGWTMSLLNATMLFSLMFYCEAPTHNTNTVELNKANKYGTMSRTLSHTNNLIRE